MKRLYIWLAVGVVVCTSCVGTKKLTIRTQPQGADITINGVPQTGVTPMTVEVSQKRDLGIVASMPGYESSAYTVTTTTNWWLSLLWTKNDPRARIIKEDEVYIPMKRVPSAGNFRVSTLPAYQGRQKTIESQVPALRSLPENLIQ